MSIDAQKTGQNDSIGDSMDLINLVKGNNMSTFKFGLGFSLIVGGAALLMSMTDDPDFKVGDFVRLKESMCAGVINSVRTRMQGDKDPSFEFEVHDCFAFMDGRDKGNSVYVRTGFISVKADRLIMVNAK